MALWDIFYNLPKKTPSRVNAVLRPLEPMYERLIEYSYRVRPQRQSETAWGPSILVDYENVNERLIVRGDFEPAVAQFFVDDICQNHESLADVGANVGFYSLLFGFHNQGDHRIDAFEPVPEIANRLRANRDINDLSIDVCTFALSGSSGISRIHASDENLGETSLSPNLYAAESTHTYTVATQTLDDLYVNGGRPAPDAIKIDVEGAEFDVIEGGERLLRETEPAVLVEIHPSMIENYADRLAATVRLLQSANYTSAYHIETDEPMGLQTLKERTGDRSFHVHLSPSRSHAQ